VILLREWLGMYEDLVQERTRLANRLRSQLWRYYPQAEELTQDVMDNWFLDLWELLPTPAKAERASEKAVAHILKNHRIRRLDAAQVLSVLRKPPLTVAPGTVDAATAHIRTLVTRLRLINQQVKESEQRIDQFCQAIEAAAEQTPGQICEQRDVAILRSCPGLGRITIATLLAKRRALEAQLERLTPREKEVLRLMAEGHPSRAIAAQLGISYTTVRTHIRSLGSKLAVHSKLEAIIKARELGLIN